MRTGDTEALYPDPTRSLIGAAPVRFVTTLLLLLLVYGFSLYFVDFDLGRLWGGLPRLAHWAAKAWPPDTSDLAVLIERAIETVAMAVVGTTIGVVIAAPCCILAAQNITPSRLALHADALVSQHSSRDRFLHLRFTVRLRRRIGAVRRGARHRPPFGRHDRQAVV